MARFIRFDEIDIGTARSFSFIESDAFIISALTFEIYRLAAVDLLFW